MKNVVVYLFLFFMLVGCHSINKRRLIKKHEHETLKQMGNVEIYVENSIEPNDIIKVIVNDSILAVCSGYRGNYYKPFACVINYNTQASHLRVKAVLNDTTEKFYIKKINVNVLNKVIIKKDEKGEIKVADSIQ